MIGQVFGRGELQLAQCDMRGVQIDRRNRRRVGHQVRQYIAPAAGNRHHAAVGADRQRFHIDIGVFPDLRIDQPAKREGKCVIEHPACNACALAHDSAGNRRFFLGLRGLHDHR